MWSPEDLGDLTPEPRALVNEWDPIGVADIQPDEYDYLTGFILARLEQGEDRASFCEFMANEARNLSASAESGDTFGAVVLAWFSSKQPPADGEGSASRVPSSARTADTAHRTGTSERGFRFDLAFLPERAFLLSRNPIRWNGEARRHRSDPPGSTSTNPDSCVHCTRFVPDMDD